jgi:hypothetical protein
MRRLTSHHAFIPQHLPSIEGRLVAAEGLWQGKRQGLIDPNGSIRGVD